MKIQVLSDLHLEHFQSDKSAIASVKLSREANVVVFAGDICSAEDAIRMLGPLATAQRPFILINGNHEFYGRDYDQLRASCREAASAFQHLHFLDRGAVTLGDVRFIGATLWTSGDYAGNQYDRYTTATICNRNTYDFKVIEKGGKAFSFFDSNEAHWADLGFIEKELQASSGLKKVVVSHHAPSSRSTHEMFKNSMINASFVSDIGDELIAQADLWIHGHTHSSHDYQIGQARVICNPRGYAKGRYFSTFENTAFIPELIIEV